MAGNVFDVKGVVRGDIGAKNRVVILKEGDAGIREKKRAVVAIAVVDVLAWEDDIGERTCEEIRSRRLLPLVEVWCGVGRVGRRARRFEGKIGNDNFFNQADIIKVP